MRLAVSGKGGVGKTTIAGTLCRVIGRSQQPVLALDADSNPNLALALGIPRIYAVANKIRTEAETTAVRTYCQQHDISLLATIPYDEGIIAAEMNDRVILDSQPDSPFVQAIEILATKLYEKVKVKGA